MSQENLPSFDQPTSKEPAPALAAPAKPRLFRKRRVESFSRRGEAYAWLIAHHDLIEARRVRGQLSWSAIVGDMARDGVKGRGGVDLTANAALKVWQRVLRDIKARAAASAAPRPKSKPPSRISPEWRPREVAVPLPLSRSALVARDRYSAPPPLPPGAPDPLDISMVDDKGQPVPPGYVFFKGEIELERVALGLRTALLEAREIDRGRL